jgi:hypothetical protein
MKKILSIGLLLWMAGCSSQQQKQIDWNFKVAKAIQNSWDNNNIAAFNTFNGNDITIYGYASTPHFSVLGTYMVVISQNKVSDLDESTIDLFCSTTDDLSKINRGDVIAVSGKILLSKTDIRRLRSFTIDKCHLL